MNIKLKKITEEEKDILYRLLQYSLYEESLNDGNKINQDAIYEYKYFNLYFTDNNRDAFLIKTEDDKLAGFAMINTYVIYEKEGHSIAEFMILPEYRKNKIGTKAANKCFELYQGIWEVTASFNSEIAFNFWKKVIEEYTNNNYDLKDRTFIFKKVGKNNQMN